MCEKDLSVLIPVYNTEEYFRKCIESVISSINKANIYAEIIVVDDGSKGNIKELIKEYIEKYPKLIEFCSQENRGRGATRNICISKSNGKYVHFVDSDDYIDENMYLKMFEKISNENELDIVVCDFDNIDVENSEKNGIIEAKSKDIEDVKWGIINELMCPSCCNKIIKKELFKDITFPEDINYEDLATIPILLLKSNRICYIEEALYKYVQNNESVMHEKYGVNQLNIIKALEKLFDRINYITSLSDLEKERAKYMISTRRYYEEILEKITLSNDKKNLEMEFLKRAKGFEGMLYANKYFNKQISIQGLKKKIGNKLLHRAIQSNSKFLLRILLNKKIYYNLVLIKYSNVDI